MKQKNFVFVSVGIIAVAVIFGVGLLCFKKIKQSMYPPAPPMPAIVSQTTEEILAQLELELKSKAPQILTNLQVGLSADRINELVHQSGVQLPEEIKALYRWHNGFSLNKLNSSGFRVAGPMPGHYFVPLEEALQIPDSLSDQVAKATTTQRAAFKILAGYTKSWITLFDNGTGDGYFFDPKRKPSEGAVFYHFTESGEYIFFPSAKNVFAGMVKCYEQNAFSCKEEASGAGLYEDFNASAKIWNEFGASSAEP